MFLFVNFNGSIVKEKSLCIRPDNRSFRYGDGFFDSIKMVGDNITLYQYHFERMFHSLELLQFDIPDFFAADYFSAQIRNLALQNGHIHTSRIRLTFFRGDGGLHETVSHYPNFIIQSWPADRAANEWTNEGIAASIFTDARISPDLFSAIKSNNYLPYVMAAIAAKKSGVDDCILLNAFDKICDATIANVFMVANGKVITPPLQDGPVSGVMRKYLLQQMRDANIPVYERSINQEEILQANEVFFTNAMIGIKWVKQLHKSQYTHQLSQFLFNKFIVPLYKPFGK